MGSQNCPVTGLGLVIHVFPVIHVFNSHNIPESRLALGIWGNERRL